MNSIWTWCCGCAVVALFLAIIVVVAVAFAVLVTNVNAMEYEMSYQPVTVESARQVAKAFAKQVVVIVAIDREYDQTNFTTYGEQPEDKTFAARLGSLIAKAIGCEEIDRESHEDFRDVPAAERAKEIEEAKQLIANVRALAEGRDWKFVSGTELLALLDGGSK